MLQPRVFSPGRARWPAAAPFAVAALLALFAPPGARATTILVDTLEDEVNSDGDCALREAVIAANTNAQVDACPAGSNDVPDLVVLQGGATYDLTLADPVAGNPAAGDLNVAANAAAPDLIVLGAGDGRATIRQQTATRIATLDAGAALVLDRLVLTGASPSSSGGAVAVSSGILEVHDCVFAKNLSLAGSGIFLSTSAASALVVDSTFADHGAGGSGSGGAIHSKGRLTVIGSRFARNHGNLAGGAIFVDANVAGALQVVDSCFVDNTDDAGRSVASAQPFTQGASGNWWSSADGPSGSGPGRGEPIGPDVDASAALARPPGHCLPWPLARNSTFRTGGSQQVLEPEGWEASAAMTAPDARGCGVVNCFYRILGDGQKKTLSQAIRIDGRAGDRLTFHARSRSNDAPAGGAYRAVGTVFHLDGSKQVTRMNFAAGTHGFESLAREVVASEPYDRVRIQIEYRKSGGEAFFTDVGVVLEGP